MRLIRKRGPAASYDHADHVVKNVNQEFRQRLSTGQRVADAVARVVGSWPFIIIQSVVIAAWMGMNIYIATQVASDPDWFKAWDPYPFILLNLVLSFQAAYTGPVVMMSQNRQAQKDRLMAELDYEVNKKAEEEIQVLMAQAVHNEALMNEVLARLEQVCKTVQDSGEE